MILPSLILKDLVVLKPDQPEREIYFRSRLLTSKNQEKEFQRILKSLPENSETILLIGGADGKFLIFLEKIDFIKKIFFYEPVWNFRLLQEAHKPILKKTIFLQSPEDVFQHKDSLQNLSFFVFPLYRRLFPQLVESIESFFSYRNDEKTRSRFQYRWQVEYVKNLTGNTYISFFSLPESVKKIIFLGSGVTLKKDLKSLHITEDTCLIASDSAIVPALHEGIPVHYVISIDPQLGTLYHFHSYKKALQSLTLLTWLGGNREIHRFFQETHFFLTTFPLDQMISRYYPRILFLPNPLRDTLGAVYSLALTYRKEFLFAGCGLEDGRKFYYTPNTGYDYYALLKNTRTFTNDFYHYLLYRNQSYRRKEFALPRHDVVNENRYQATSVSTDTIKNILYNHKQDILKEFPFLETFYKLVT